MDAKPVLEQLALIFYIVLRVYKFLQSYKLLPRSPKLYKTVPI